MPNTMTISPEILAMLNGDAGSLDADKIKELIATEVSKANGKKEPAKERKARGTKKKTDPEKPKRPQNAYMLFASSVRDEVRATLLESSPDGKVPVSLVAKEIGKWWANGFSPLKNYEDNEEQKQADIDEFAVIKKKFEDEFTASKEKYDEELSEYYEKYPERKETKATRKTNEKKTKVTEANTEGLPPTPENWGGPFEGAVVGHAFDLEAKANVTKKFKDFSDALVEATRLADGCTAIVRTKRGYALRAGKKIVSNAATASKGEVCWIKPSMGEVDAKPFEDDYNAPTDDEMPPLEPAVDEPAVDEPVAEEPAAEEKPKEPVAEEPVTEEKPKEPVVESADESDSDSDDEADCVEWEFEGKVYALDEATNELMDPEKEHEDGSLEVIGKRVRKGKKWAIQYN